MGLDAFVRCRCFEEKKLKPGPVPYEDLYIDEDGYLYSRTLNEAENKLGWEKYYEEFKNLTCAFDKWREDPCEHEWGEACSEQVGNFSGKICFRILTENSGGKEKYPLLSNMLPSGNNGCYPVELAEPTLKELDSLIEDFKHLDGWVLKKKKLQNLKPPLYEKPADEKLHVEGEKDPDAIDEDWCDNKHSSGLLYCGDYHVDLVQNKVVFTDPPETRSSSHFIEELIPCATHDAAWITFLDSGERFRIEHHLREDYFDKKCERYEFWTERATNLYYHSTERYTLEALRRLLVTSIELQNPIVWC